MSERLILNAARVEIANIELAVNMRGGKITRCLWDRYRKALDDVSYASLKRLGVVDTDAYVAARRDNTRATTAKYGPRPRRHLTVTYGGVELKAD